MANSYINSAGKRNAFGIDTRSLGKMEAAAMHFQRTGLIWILSIAISLAASTVYIAAQGTTSSERDTPMAVLRGKIWLIGAAPAPIKFNTRADPSCSPFDQVAENVVVSNQGLENSMVFVSSPVADLSAPDTPAVLEMHNCRFEPHVLTLQVGQRLNIRNNNQTLYNVHAITQRNAPLNTGLPVPMTVTKSFDKPEVPVPIRDDIHKWMSAFLGIFNHPFHTVSKSGGLYELRLPPGSYEITAWHEKYGTVTKSVTVNPGENPALDFNFVEQP